MPPYGPQDYRPDQPHPPAQPAPGPPGYGNVGTEHPQGTTILVLGILGLTACQVLGPFAWWMGNEAMREIDRNPAAYTNRGMVQAGRICGIVSTALLILLVLYLVVLLFTVGALVNR